MKPHGRRQMTDSVAPASTSAVTGTLGRITLTPHFCQSTAPLPWHKGTLRWLGPEDFGFLSPQPPGIVGAGPNAVIGGGPTRVGPFCFWGLPSFWTTPTGPRKA